MFGSFYAVFVFDFVDAPYFEIAVSELRTINKNVWGDKLAVIFVGSHHVGIESGFFGFFGECSYYIIGFVSCDFYNGYIIGSNDLFDNGYRLADYFGRFFPLRFIFLIGFMSESRTGRIESDGDVRRVLFTEDFFECIDKTEDGRCVYPFGVDTRIFDETVISPVDEGVSIE